MAALPLPPGPGVGQQNSFRNETHQLWPDAIGFPDPIVYKFDLLVRTHSFTTSQVLPINALGQPVQSFDADGNTFPAGHRADAAAEHDLRVQRHVPRSRGSTPSTASRCWSGSRTTWTRTR